METILIVWNVIILLAFFIREWQHYVDKKDLLNTIMAKDYTQFAKYEKKVHIKPEFPAHMTEEEKIEALKRSK